VKQGDVFSTSAIDNSLGNIHDPYMNGAYADIGAVATRKPKLNPKVINHFFEINESSKYFVNDIGVY